MKKSLAFALCIFLSLWSWGLYRSHCHLYDAITYLNSNDTPQAIRELKRSIKLSPFNIVSRYYEAGLKAKDNPVEALILYERLEEKNPNFLLTHYFKSLNYKKLGMYKEAYIEILKAERLYPLSEVIQAEKSIYIIKRRIYE